MSNTKNPIDLLFVTDFNPVPNTDSSQRHFDWKDKSDQLRNCIMSKVKVDIANCSNMSFPCKKCMKCGVEIDILISSHGFIFNGVIGRCDHKFCQSCFRIENTNSAFSRSNNTFNCPCCHASFYKNMKSIEEAVMFGEATNLSDCISPQLFLKSDPMAPVYSVTEVCKLNTLVIENLEAALRLNPTNFDTLYFLYLSCCGGHRFLVEHNLIAHSLRDSLPFYRSKFLDYSYRLLDHPAIPEHYEFIRGECFYELACIFHTYSNYPAAVKYAKLAYEFCLRSSDQTGLSIYKDIYLESRGTFSQLSPLRFAVGDQVEFLHELEAESDWKLGKVVELYYVKSDFHISFTAPYRIQLLVESASANQPPVYAWVKADIDRYVRKVGVRSIEDTRYQAKLSYHAICNDVIY